MAAETQYFTVAYDNEASGPFVALSTTLLTWDAGASTGFIVKVVDDGTTGTLKVALYTGTLPDDDDVLTQGSTTADANGAAELMLYPAFFREDVAVAQSGVTSWTGPALGTTPTASYSTARRSTLLWARSSRSVAGSSAR